MSIIQKFKAVLARTDNSRSGGKMQIPQIQGIEDRIVRESEHVRREANEEQKRELGKIRDYDRKQQETREEA